MFLKIFYYFTLIFLALSSLPAFSASVCEVEGFSDPRRSLSSPRVSSSPQVPSSSRRRGSTGIESYSQLLVRSAQSRLGIESLTPEQVKALETYHDVVRGEEGTDGTFARVGNYTFPQRRRIIKYLRQVFTPEQVTTLIENGVVEINFSSQVKITRRVLKNFKEGQKVFIRTGSDKVVRLSTILEETNSGWLVEAESVNNGSGQIVKEQIFFIKGDVKTSSLLEVNPADMTGISERTSRGFIIDVLIKIEDSSSPKEIKGNKVFFSFEKAIENGLLPRNPTAQDYQKLEHILDSYISNNHDQLVQALKVVGSSFASSLFLYAHLNPLLQKSFITGQHKFVLANPELESIFLAVESTRKRVSSRELGFPFFSNRESEGLSRQGYRANYTEGIDYINEWAMLRRRFRELRVNPRTTHIEYFANKVPLHIAHIRKGLEENYSQEEASRGSKLKQLQELDNLEKKAKEAISEERVTYEWWIEFNFSLAYLMAGNTINPGLITWVNSNLFPVKIVMPVLQELEGLGIMTFNRTGLEGLHPVGLINSQNSKVHGGLDAALFFAHDLQHPMFSGNKHYLGYSVGHQLFHRRLLNNIENLPPDKRKKAESIYFLMTHEYQERDISYSDRTLRQMREEVIRKISHNDAELFKFSEDPVQKTQKVKDLADIFMEVYIQALQHQ